MALSCRTEIIRYLYNMLPYSTVSNQSNNELFSNSDLCPVIKVQKKPLIGTKKWRRLLPTFTADMEGL